MLPDLVRGRSSDGDRPIRPEGKLNPVPFSFYFTATPETVREGARSSG
ncbi:hypothetical protein [Lyngbya sp. CCY1209]|nr:hypothetical protein [Lyngbya sp. CCY1209]MEB3883097.1 hypothetical protein [Lyngbya sp. CCY1209]